MSALGMAQSTVSNFFNGSTKHILKRNWYIIIIGSVVIKNTMASYWVPAALGLWASYLTTDHH